MEENDIWNPTQRLYQILESTKRFAKSKNGQPNKIRETWAGVFNLEPVDTIAIYYNLTLMSQSLDWTISELDKAQLKRKEIYTRNLPKIHKALNVGNLDGGWNIVEQYLNEETMADLLHCADRLAESDAESELSREELSSLYEELDALATLFSDSALDDDLRVAILDLLESARQMLSDYRIRGSAALKDIIELSLGKLMTKRTQLAKAEKNGNLGKLFDWLRKVDDLYSRLKKYAPLLQGVSMALLEKTKEG